MGFEYLKARWTLDISGLDDQGWGVVGGLWECSFLQLVSVKDRLVQFKILHRIYLTSVRPHRIFLSIPAVCWRCSADSVDSIHIFWQYPQIQKFWVDVISFIYSVTTIQIPQTVEVCLQGLVDPLAHHRAPRTLVRLLLFMQEI